MGRGSDSRSRPWPAPVSRIFTVLRKCTSHPAWLRCRCTPCHQPEHPHYPTDSDGHLSALQHRLSLPRYWGPLGKRKISHAKTIFYTVTVCCFALTLRIVCRVVRNSLAIALILAPDLMRSSTFCVCSSFNTGGRPKRFPASRALAIPE